VASQVVEVDHILDVDEGIGGVLVFVLVLVHHVRSVNEFKNEKITLFKQI